MPGLTIGGFYIREYEATRSWGIEPASASGVGVVEQGGEPTIATGDYVTYAFFGVTFYGIISSLERQRSLSDGDEWSFQVLDNRIRLRWAIVFGQWNMEEDPARIHSDPVPERPSALDEWYGGQVGFDQGVDFQGGIESEMGSPRPLVSDGSSKRGRLFSHIPPAYWASQSRVYSEQPRTVAEILQEACQGAKGGGGVALALHAVQQKPVLNIDANSGMSLAALIQQLADAQGLQVTMDGASTLRFERRGSSTVVVPPGAHLRRIGTAISSEPTKVRIVGGRRLVQVNEVPLEPDWNRSWEKFLAEPAWLAEVESILTVAGPQPDGAAHRAEIAARAREITLSQYITLKGLQLGSEEELAQLEADYFDPGRWQSVSRMDLPVWKYLNSIVFRSYRIPHTAELYGLPMRSLEMEDRLLCAVKIASIGGQTRISYREDPLEFYPQSSAFIIAKGQPLDLSNVEQTDALLRQRSTNLKDTWSEIQDFTLDTEAKAVRFSSPVFMDGSAEDGKSILLYPNQGQGGGTDLSADLEGTGSTYLDIVVPNPDYELSIPEVRAAFVFRLGVFYKDVGTGARWTSYHAPVIAEHLLHGADGFEPEGTAAFEGNAGVPEPPGAWREILYDNGETAAQLAARQADGVIVRSGVEQSGEYLNVGVAGTTLNSAIDRITIRLTRESGLTETVEFAKPRPSRGFVSSREIADRVRNDELFDGQVDLRREVSMLRAIARAQRHVSSQEKPRNATHASMPDLFRKPLGRADHEVRTLADPNSQYPVREGVTGWRSGDLVWLDQSGLPSRSGSEFGGVVVMDSPMTGGEGSESPVKYVTVARTGTVPVRVKPGLVAGARVMARRGEAVARWNGDIVIGRLAHAEDAPKPEGAEDAEIFALVELSNPVPAGRYHVEFDPGIQRLIVYPGSVGRIDVFKPGKVVPEHPVLGEKAINDPSWWSLASEDNEDPPEDAETIKPGEEYQVLVRFDDGQCVMELREAQSGGSGGDEDEEQCLVIATVTFKAGLGNKLEVEEFEQLWESDILWPDEMSSSSSEEESSSEESSETSSEESGQSEGSEKSSNAIVRMPWHDSGYGALATRESDEVLLDFNYRDVVLIGPVTVVPIDPRHLFLCVKDSIRVFGSPCGGIAGLSVGVEIRGRHMILRASRWRWLRPGKVDIQLTGVRRGFGKWKMPPRTYQQFLQAEAWNRSAYDRKPGES